MRCHDVICRFVSVPTLPQPLPLPSRNSRQFKFTRLLSFALSLRALTPVMRSQLARYIAAVVFFLVALDCSHCRTCRGIVAAAVSAASIYAGEHARPYCFQHLGALCGDQFPSHIFPVISSDAKRYTLPPAIWACITLTEQIAQLLTSLA